MNHKPVRHRLQYLIGLTCLLLIGMIYSVGQKSYAQQLPPVPTPTPAPLPSVGHPFDYILLPATHGPAEDIVEVLPLTASRTVAQVDDSITFSVTIKNKAPYDKMLYDVCFESTDGNFGCQFAIPLRSGQTFTLNNVGTWTVGGTKKVWITWSQNFRNYYIPMNARSVQVTILG